MEADQKINYREAVPHVTNTRPYAVHRTHFGPEQKCALYLHWHPEIELCYLEEGELDFQMEDRHYHMNGGDAVLVPPGVLHRADCVSGKPGSFLAFCFLPEFITGLAEGMQFQKYVQPVLYQNRDSSLYLSPKTEWQREVLTDLKRLFSLAESAECAELAVAGLVLVIWQNLYNRHFSALIKDRQKEKLERQLGDVLCYMREHFQEDLSLKNLADTAHMSEGQFCRSFKRLTGSTPFTWLNRFRIMESCVCLSGSDKKIGEIAMQCGFNNISYFNREFLRVMKVTPSAYRKQGR